MEPTMATDPLLRRVAALSWPTPLDDQPDPAPGQLWRAAWAGISSLVVIAAPHHDRTVPVYAATADGIGDDAAIVADTTHGLRPSVWVGITNTIKMFTLEHRITNLTDESLAAAASVAAGERRGDWPPIINNLDDRALVRADLREWLGGLANAEWRPAVDPNVTSLSAHAAAAGLQPSQVADALGISPGDARRLLQGKREPSTQELAILTDLFGAAPGVVVEFDDELVADLDLPEFRPQLRLIASSEHGGDEAAARRAFAGRMLALAARQRESGRRNWVALIREVLRED
jgi:transcriptional regulator with XRE-family HTH domain